MLKEETKKKMAKEWVESDDFTINRTTDNSTFISLMEKLKEITKEEGDTLIIPPHMLPKNKQEIKK